MTPAYKPAFIYIIMNPFIHANMFRGLFHQAFVSLSFNLRGFEVIIYVSKTVYFKSKTFLFYKKQLISWKVMEFCILNSFQIKYWSFS